MTSCNLVFRMFIILGLLLCIQVVSSVWSKESKYKTEFDAPRAIEKLGFRAKMYKLMINELSSLALYRIINPLADPRTLNIYPVIYGHGFTMQSESMISRAEKARPRKPELGKPTVLDEIKGQEDSPNDRAMPFMLSNNNFDVWLFDARGASSATRELSSQLLPGEAQRFWDFSLDDQSLVDLPTVIDFVLNKTHATKVIQFGYSESTWFALALLSQRPEFGQKLAASVLMAPIAYLGHLTSPALYPLMALLKMTPQRFNYNLMPQAIISALSHTMRKGCRLPFMDKLVCSKMVEFLAGRGRGQFHPDFFKSLLKGNSLKNARHMVQLHSSKKFRKYDYGKKDNMKIYGQEEAPDYNLTSVTFDRIVLVRGLKDLMSVPIDQERIINELGRKPLKDIVIPTYNHFDFIDGEDLIEKVNQPILSLLFNLLYLDSPANIFANFADEADFNPHYNESSVEIQVQPSGEVKHLEW